MNRINIVRGVIGLACALAASAGQAQVFSVSPGSPVPPAGTTGTGQYDLVVAGGPAVITDVNVIISITHTWNSDLDIILVPPAGGVYIHLCSDVGGPDDNFINTRFDQSATTLITTGLAPFTGSFRPEGGDVMWRAAAAIALPGSSLADLSALNGTNSNGTWSLIIDDDAGGDLGTLNNFTIELNGFGDPNTIIGSCCLSSGCQVISQADCATQGGSFNGPNTDCGIDSFAISTPSTGSAFESIAATGTNLGVVSNADDVTENVQIGFSFTYFGTPFTNMNVSSNGNIQFPPSNSASWTNLAIPNAAAPNNMIAPLWDDLNPLTQGDVYVQTLGTAGTDLRTIVSWEGVTQFALVTNENFQVVLFENGAFEFRYGAITPETPAGDYTIGYENAAGTSGGSIAGSEIGAGDTARRFTLVPGVNPCNSSACPACPADFDQDGGVTGSDIGAFFAEFEQGGACGDTDLDGGITGGDIAAFFAAFEAGGC